MIREVDLVSYLPPFIAEYKEINTALAAENPEFQLIWEAADRALRNEFIETADEYGISRFEKMMGLFPSKEDSLESRRLKVRSKWFTVLPYTWRMLMDRLLVLCGDRDFQVYVPQKEGYELRVDISIEPESEFLLLEAKGILDGFLPANLCYLVTGVINRKRETKIRAGSMKALCVKIKASPEDGSRRVTCRIPVKTRTLTSGYIRAAYKPIRSGT